MRPRCKIMCKDQLKKRLVGKEMAISDEGFVSGLSLTLFYFIWGASLPRVEGGGWGGGGGGVGVFSDWELMLATEED